MNYNIVMSTTESTVVAEYEPQKTRSDAYQSEQALEYAFIKMLTEQGYERLTFHSQTGLIDNCAENTQNTRGLCSGIEA